MKTLTILFWFLWYNKVLDLTLICLASRYWWWSLHLNSISTQPWSIEILIGSLGLHYDCGNKFIFDIWISKPTCTFRTIFNHFLEWGSVRWTKIQHHICWRLLELALDIQLNGTLELTIWTALWLKETVSFVNLHDLHKLQIIFFVHHIYCLDFIPGGSKCLIVPFSFH